jgi:hypothetical protein
MFESLAAGIGCEDGLVLGVQHGLKQPLSFESLLAGIQQLHFRELPFEDAAVGQAGLEVGEGRVVPE